MPRGWPLAICHGCGNEVSPESHVSYEGDPWHNRCLRRWAKNKLGAIERRKVYGSLAPDLIDQIDELRFVIESCDRYEHGEEQVKKETEPPTVGE